MYFLIVPLSSELIFIKWYRLPQPGTSPEKDILGAIRNLLDTAPGKIYFLSDLRGGRIMDLRLLQQLAKFTQHANWGEGTAFAKDSMSKMFAKVYSQFSNTIEVRREIWDTPEEAIAFLESIKPGISEGIEWEKVLTPLQS
jgi:hypothetical protein